MCGGELFFCARKCSFSRVIPLTARCVHDRCWVAWLGATKGRDTFHSATQGRVDPSLSACGTGSCEPPAQRDRTTRTTERLPCPRGACNAARRVASTLRTARPGATQLGREGKTAMRAPLDGASPWFTLVRPSSLWFALVRLGSPWFALVRLGSHGSPWFALVRLGSPWFALDRMVRMDREQSLGSDVDGRTRCDFELELGLPGPQLPPNPTRTTTTRRQAVVRRV